jgi:hypothetical protein
LPEWPAYHRHNRRSKPLLATGLVTWSHGDPATPVEFAHPLFRAAIYDDLPLLRSAQHRAAAGVLDPRAALVHRVAAADTGNEALIDDLIAAARSEAARGSLSLGRVLRHHQFNRVPRHQTRNKEMHS